MVQHRRREGGSVRALRRAAAGSAAARSEASSATRHFRHEAPVAVVGDPPVATFVSLVTDTTGRMLEQFLREHGRLFAWLPAWTVVAIGPRPSGLHACEGAFERYLRRPMQTVSASTDDDLVWFFRTRQTVDEGDLTGLSVTAIDRFRTLREAFRRPVFDELYLAWQRDGEAVWRVLRPPGCTTGRGALAPS